MLKLVQTDWGVFDIDFAGAQDGDAAAASLVWAALFTDALADADALPAGADRRGWWHESSLGSTLWALRGQALSDALRRQVLDEVRRTLATQKELLDVVVTEAQEPATTGRNVSLVYLNIVGKHNASSFNFDLSFDLSAWPPNQILSS